MATLYIGIGFYYFMETREAGLVFIFYSLFMIWATDSGAYFIGKELGKRNFGLKLVRIKRLKGNWEECYALLWSVYFMCLLTDIDVAIIWIAVVTIFLSIFGQIGDLVESALKRHYK